IVKEPAPEKNNTANYDPNDEEYIYAHKDERRIHRARVTVNGRQYNREYYGATIRTEKSGIGRIAAKLLGLDMNKDLKMHSDEYLEVQGEYDRIDREFAEENLAAFKRLRSGNHNFSHYHTAGIPLKQYNPGFDYTEIVQRDRQPLPVVEAGVANEWDFPDAIKFASEEEYLRDFANVPKENIPAIRKKYNIPDDAKFVWALIGGREVRVNVSTDDFGTVLDDDNEA
ncbi:MAG: hypothetical protein LBM09_02615, partial [Candidatus Nomurabacteria bacterium]|nr:hypothetical protein [Candidatus Nomurabacteria bacterium]